jgi:hypothetical protein
MRLESEGETLSEDEILVGGRSSVRKTRVCLKDRKLKIGHELTDNDPEKAHKDSFDDTLLSV